MGNFKLNVLDLKLKVWPIGQRYAFCYTARRGPDQNSCNAKDGNPFGPFWDHHHVKFDGSVMYGPLSFDVHRQNDVNNWMTKYPADRQVLFVT